jgi:2-polyprenyl-3-methyl-5-hydroxy-6-metoxy-1,4-benzoquinol methylase
MVRGNIATTKQIVQCFAQDYIEEMNPRPARATAESQFYDRYARQLTVSDLEPTGVFAPTCLENIHLMEAFGDLRGQRVLDIGCGQGDTSVAFALRGAEVWALDVSERMVELTNQLAAHHGVADRVHAEVGRVEDMRHETGHFDMLFADGVLHHLDLQQAVPNLARVLKPGGRGYFLEPQKGSLFIEIYRMFARDLRTPDERPFEEKDFQWLSAHFKEMVHREYHLLSLTLFATRFLQLKLTGRAFPYWMDDVRQGKFFPRALRVFQELDDWLLQRVPPLRRWCWLTVITVRN